MLKFSRKRLRHLKLPEESESEQRAQSCCVVLCTNTQTNSDLTFHAIPDAEEDTERADRWLKAIRAVKYVTYMQCRGARAARTVGSIPTSCVAADEFSNGRWWQKFPQSVVCAEHFVSGAPSLDPGDVDYAPSVFPEDSSAARSGQPAALVTARSTGGAQRGYNTLDTHVRWSRMLVEYCVVVDQVLCREMLTGAKVCYQSNVTVSKRRVAPLFSLSEVSRNRRGVRTRLVARGRGGSAGLDCAGAGAVANAVVGVRDSVDSLYSSCGWETLCTSCGYDSVCVCRRRTCWARWWRGRARGARCVCVYSVCVCTVCVCVQCVCVQAAHVLGALVAGARAGSSLCSSQLYRRVLRDLRIGVNVGTLHAACTTVWYYSVCTQGGRPARGAAAGARGGAARGLGGGGAPPLRGAPGGPRAATHRRRRTQTAAPRAYPIQLYSSMSRPTRSLQCTCDTVYDVVQASEWCDEEYRALGTLCRLVRRHGAEVGGKPGVKATGRGLRGAELELRWSRVYAGYRATGRTASVIVLQRRWHELKLQAREAGARSHLHRAVARQHPHVLRAPPRAWRQLVLDGDVLKLPRPLPADPGPDEAVPGPLPGDPGPDDLPPPGDRPPDEVPPGDPVDGNALPADAITSAQLDNAVKIEFQLESSPP
ncbi:hypothetical protein SFRURICE_020979, partial [Spodoptera frugiperda]